MCDSSDTGFKWLDLARKASSENRWAEAVKICTKGLNEENRKDKQNSGGVPQTSNGLPPSRSTIFCERAEMYLKICDAQNCVKDAKEAVRLEPKNVQGYCLLGAGFLQLKLFGHAEVEVKKGLKVDHKNRELKRLLQEIQWDDEERVPPCRGLDGSDRKVRDLQNEAGEKMDVRKYPEIVKGIMVGNVSAVRLLWRSEHMKERVTPCKNPPIHMPVLGRQRIKDFGGAKVPTKNYCDMIDFLFEQGNRLDHCDKIGYTALMHAAGHAAEPELLQHLLKKGADPNIRSVYGSVALTDACIAQNDKMVDMLLRHGADPNIPCNDGMSPLQFVRPYKKLVAVFDKYLNAETIKRACMNCDSRSGISRCKACRYAFYCSKECQLAHWSSHKERCKLTKKSHMRLKVVPNEPGTHLSLFSNMPETVLNNVVNARHNKPKMKAKITLFESKAFEEFEKSWKKGGNILKLQINRDHPDEGVMLMYNKNKDLCFQMSSTELNGPEVVRTIKEKGVKGLTTMYNKENVVKGMEGTHGLKGYFLGFVEKPGEIVIITNPVLPAQPW